MGNEYPIARLAEVAEKIGMGPFGSSIKVETFVELGIPIISGQHLKGSRLQDSEFNFITLEHADRLANANVRRGDVIFTHAGNIGQVAFIPQNSMYDRYVISQRQFYLRPNTKKVIPEYITYYFLTTEGRHKLLANASSTGVPSIAQPVTYLRSLGIPLPSLAIQSAIVSILGSLDDKIELNRQINEKLEAIAQALFKSWFIDFYPVRAKAEGRDTGLPEQISSLFPSSLVDSEQGPIPEGWRVGSLTEIASIISGGTPKTTKIEYWGDEIPWFSMVDYPSHGEVYILETEKKITQEGLRNSAAQLIDPGVIILSARGTVGKFAIAAVPMTFNQSCYALKGTSAPYGSPFLFYSLKKAIDTLKAYSHGSVFSTITRDTLSIVKICIPDEKLALMFGNCVEGYFGKVLVNSKQNIVLNGLRDVLLPGLISGELPIPDAERIVGRCV